MSILSNSWHRVRDYRPRLPSAVEIFPQDFRGTRWYILQHRATGQFVRFSRATFGLIGLMDGERSVEQIWKIASEKLDEDMPTQDEVIQVLGQLHRIGALAGNVPPTICELASRARASARRRTLQRFLNPIMLRIRVCDPNGALNSLSWLARILFSRASLALWLLLVGLTLMRVPGYWPALTQNLADRVLAADNIVLLALTLAVVKLVHELGHALAVKAWGGEVHEIGVMLLVLIPLPYVDASAASAFRSKWARIAVGAAGMMLELVLAIAAFEFWVRTEPGLARAAAFNVMLVASISTVLFNGNPLLRYDAYYMLSDLIEIPNLASRAARYWGEICGSFLAGRSRSDTAQPSRGEAAWFLFYAPASFMYRIVISIGIAIFLAKKYFTLGVALAIWSLVATFVFPLSRALLQLVRSPKLERARFKAVRRGALAAAALVALLVLLPVPNRTVAPGVVMAESDYPLVAQTDGFVSEIMTAQSVLVARGTPLLRLINPLIEREKDVRAAEVRVLELKHAAAQVKNLVDAEVLAQELAYSREQQAFVENKWSKLLVRSSIDGIVFLAKPHDMLDRFVPRGELLGYIAADARTIQVLIREEDVGLVRSSLKNIQVRFAHDKAHRLRGASLSRLVPSASRQLPTPALGTSAGGEISTTPSDNHGRTSLSPYFKAEIKLAEPPESVLLGERVYVRFDYGYAPAVWHIARAARLLFLRELRI